MEGEIGKQHQGAKGREEFPQGEGKIVAVEEGTRSLL